MAYTTATGRGPVATGVATGRPNLRIPPPAAIACPGAAIAQLVEHIIRNDGVGGSNPSCGTI